MKKKPVVLASLTILLTLPFLALAASPTVWVQTVLNNFLGLIVWPIFFSVSILVLIWAGFLFLTAQGDPAKITASKKLVIWAIVGIVVAILAFSVINVIEQIVAPPPS